MMIHRGKASFQEVLRSNSEFKQSTRKFSLHNSTRQLASFNSTQLADSEFQLGMTLEFQLHLLLCH